MLAREIIHMYKVGDTDPRQLLNKMRKEALENPDDSDEEVRIANAKKQALIPNLTCFKKKNSDDTAANWSNWDWKYSLANN